MPFARLRDQCQKFRTHGRVMALVAACILPMWVFVGYLSFTSFDHGRQELEQSLSLASRTQLHGLEREIAMIEASLRALATSPNLDRGDLSGFYAQAQEVLRHSPGLNIVLLGPKGEQLLNTLRPLDQTLPSQPPDFFPRVLATRQPVLSDLFIGPVTGHPLISFAVPVLRDDRVAYVLGLSLDAAHLAPVIRQGGYPATWVAAILDSGGTLVTRTREPEKYVGQKAVPAVLDGIRSAAPDGVIEVSSLEGTPLVAAYSRSKRYGWTSIVAVPRNSLEANLRRSLLLSLGGGTGLLLLTMSSAGLLWRSFTASEKARERSRMLLQYASDGVHILDAEGNVIEASDSFCRMLGYEKDEIIGMNVAQWDALMPPAELGDYVRRQFRKRETSTFETRHRRKDGSIFDAEVSGHPLELDGQSILYNASRDITGRKQAEATLQKANRELEQFAYVASHDLREPLRMISSYIALLGRRHGEHFDDEGREYLDFAREGAQRMDRMVLDLLQLSRVGRMGDPFAEVALAETVATAIDNLKLVIEETGADISIAADLPTVTGLRGELARLFQNLIGNALKYREPTRPPRIVVGVAQGAREWILSVTDNGIGIGQEYFERIFDIFQRLHTRKDYEGNGIGLAISRKIVEHHGGRIWVTSEPGQGTTFFFTLPRDAEAATVP